MTCGCDDKCELPKALQINNPGEVTLFHRVEIPASQGDDETYPPKNGLYRNVLLVYLANNHAYLYSSDGIPTRVDGDSAAGVPKGGLTGQVLMKKTNEDYDTKWETQTSANDAKLTLTRNNTEIGDFTANASVDKTIDIEVPTKTSDLINDGATGESTYAEATDINAIWQEIEDIEAASDVTDVVGTYADLEAYDTSKLKDNDIIKILEDETQNDQITYYRWDTDTDTFTLIGAIGPYYTKSESDSIFQDKLTAGSNITIDANNEISATDTTYTAGEGININGTTIDAKVRRVYDYYTSRPASANTTATGNGGMFTFQATSAMTTGKPKEDSQILQLEWDNTGGWDSQVAFSHNSAGPWMAIRGQGNGTWGNWVYLLNDVAGSVKTANIDALAVTTAKIANGAVTAAKIASGVLAYSTFEGLSGGTSGYWKRIGNVTFAQHQQGKSVLLKILLGLGNNSNDHQQAFIDLVGQLAWTGSNNGRAGWTAEFNRMNNESSTSVFDIKVIANSVTSYDVYIRTASGYTSVTPIFIPGLHSDGTENAVWTPDYSAWTATAPSGTECDIAKTSVAMQADLPTKTSDLTNDGSDNTSTYVEADELQPSYIEGEGTSITFTSTQGAQFKDIELKGDTKQGATLPSGYTQVEYIQNTTDAYFSFPFALTGADTITMDVQLTGAANNWATLWSARNDGAINTNTSFVNVSTGEVRGDYATNQGSTTVTGATSRHVYQQARGNYFIDGVQKITRSATNFNTPTTTTVMASNMNGGNIANYGRGKIYSLTIVRDYGLIHNFVPAVRNADSRAGLYDTVADKFYVNTGTGQFTAGNPTPTPDVPQTVQTVTGEQTIVINDGGQQSQTYTINLGTTELCKIGNYQDYIYQSGGDWYVHKVIDKVVDNGAKDYTARTNTSATYSKFYTSTDDLLGYPIMNPTALVSDYFIANIGANDAAYSGSAACGNSTSGYKKRLWYSVPNSIATTTSAFKTWLQSNPVTTYYVMGTAMDVQITGSIADQLNALASATGYSGTTVITATVPSPDLPAILSLSTALPSALPLATTTSVGMVSVGDGLEADANGRLSIKNVDDLVYASDPTTPIDNVVDPYTYSTTETRIGTWIDGKPIYRRVFSGTASSANVSLSIGTGVVDQFTSILGYRTTGSGPYDTIVAFYNTSSDYFRCWARKTGAGVATVELRNGASGYKYFAIVEYTKVSD